MTRSLGSAPRVVSSVFANAALRRVELAFVAFNAGEWGVWIAMLVYAYDRGGATTAGLVALAQLVPAALFAPFAATLGDRHRPGRVLALAYAAQAAALAATAATLLGDGPPLLAYALGAVAATAVTVTRPAQAALLPSLARTADELTATNVVSGWVESVSVLGAPALAGLLLGWHGAGAVFAVMAALLLVGCYLVAPIAGPDPVGEDEGRPGVLRLLLERPGLRMLVALLGAQYLVIGALDVLFVVLAVSVLGIGGSGAGYLNAAFGAGGVAGIAVTAALVGRARFVPPLAAAVAVWAASFVALGARPSTVAAFALLAVAGAGRSVFDVAGRTLLQRVAPTDVLARVFGALEAVSMVGLALGAVLAPLLVNTVGARTAIVAVGLTLPLALVLSLGALRALDAGGAAHVVEIALLRSIPIFAPLGAPALEGLARSLRPLTVSAGTDVVRLGEEGSEYYVIADGELSVSVGRTLRRGDGFGEIALLAGVPRTATVTAIGDAQLYALAQDDFLSAVTGHHAARAEADRLVRERLHGEVPRATMTT
jgi:predicted MFS family arabinose efflux permease